MSATPIRVCLIEDDEDDYLITRDLLAKLGDGKYSLNWVATYDDAAAALDRNDHDVYLLDYRLGPRDGLELLRRSSQAGAPIIMLTGTDDRNLDHLAMKAGAADYLSKGRIDAHMLEHSIRYAIERRRTQEALRRSHDELEDRVRERTTALQKANDALQEADRRKDEFLAMLAHELRNPLAPVRNALHILKMPETSASVDRQAREMMERQVQHLARLVDDLLDVSRTMRGKIQLRREPVDLATVVGRAVEIAQPEIDAHGHKLLLSLPVRPILVDGDLVRLAQVLSNLLVNAAKYMEKTGRIWLSAEREGDMVVVTVKDLGIGIDPELLPRIFDIGEELIAQRLGRGQQTQHLLIRDARLGGCGFRMHPDLVACAARDQRHGEGGVAARM